MLALWLAVAGLEARLEERVQAATVQVGFAAVHVESGARAGFAADTRFPMASVYKLPIALQVLHRIDAGQDRLDGSVRITPADRRGGARAIAARDTTRTVRALLEAMLVHSDNTASDLLLRRAGGPAAVTERMRALGAADVRVDRYEQELLRGKVRFDDGGDTATPQAMADLLVRLVRGEVLSPGGTAYVLDILERTETGPRRLKGKMPPDTPVAHKTGTLAGHVHDVGVITLPHGRGHWAVAAFVAGSKDVQQAEDLIADLARLVYDHAPEVDAQQPHAHGDAARATHRFEDPERWTSVWDDPERDTWQEPERVVASLRLAPGQRVADIGAGTGYFNPHLARGVGESGRVYAVDVEPRLVEHMRERARRDRTPQVEPVLGAYEDPRLPEVVDRILLVDTYHHIDARVEYFGRLRQRLAAGGRLVNVDWKPGPLPLGPPPDHKLAARDVVSEMRRAGWALVEWADLRYQTLLVFEAAP